MLFATFIPTATCGVCDRPIVAYNTKDWVQAQVKLLKKKKTQSPNIHIFDKKRFKLVQLSEKTFYFQFLVDTHFANSQSLSHFCVTKENLSNPRHTLSIL